MVNSGESSPAASAYYSARSRTASIVSQPSSGANNDDNSSPQCAAAGSSAASSRRRSFADVPLAPLTGGEGNPRIQLSSNAKRQFKDRRIYVNGRTGLPVRPPTSFGLFKHALRRAMGNKVGFLEFNKRATERWARMGDADKEPYVQRARDLLEHFKKVEVQLLRKKVREMLN